MALPTLVERLATQQGASVLLSCTFERPGSRLWRTLPMTTIAEWWADGALTLRRFHPHLDAHGQDCSGRFMLRTDQVRALLAGWTEAIGLNLWLPQPGHTRTRVERLPDGGLQFTRYERALSRTARVVVLDAEADVRAVTFRLFAQDFASFLDFARLGVYRFDCES